MTHDAREILLKMPSQIEIADALMNIPRGPHHETVARMAMALDCLRDGGWEFVKEEESQVERLKDLLAGCLTVGGPGQEMVNEIREALA